MNSKKIKIIAEIGWNHMGDLDLATKMIQSASENGADICKFQTWSEKNLKPGEWDSDGRRDIYKKAQLSYEDHIKLIEICNSLGVEFLTSIFNENDIDFLSNGFKIRNSDADYNESAQTFIYAAFAEMPFKYANAR